MTHALLRFFPLRLSVPAEAMLLIQLSVCVAALSRGLNYTIIDTHVTLRESPIVQLVNQALPLHLWGVLFMAAAAMVVLGMKIPSLPTTVIGHTFLAATYTIFGVGSLWYALTDDVPGGWQTGVGWIFVQGVVHAVLSDRCLDAWRDQRTLRRCARAGA